jgi:hypothetical protein
MVKVKNARYHYRQWLLQAPLGLVLTGAGLCLVSDAAAVKQAGGSWVLYGTFALCVFNAGLSIFGNSILHRVRYERLEA